MCEELQSNEPALLRIEKKEKIPGKTTFNSELRLRHTCTYQVSKDCSVGFCTVFILLISRIYRFHPQNILWKFFHDITVI